MDERDLTQQERAVYLSGYARNLIRFNINLVIPWWLMAGLAYYQYNDNFITDDFYDELGALLKTYGPVMRHKHKYLINLKELTEGGTLSGFNVNWANVPKHLLAATNLMLDIASGREKLPVGEVVDLHKRKLDLEREHGMQHMREFFESHSKILADLPYPTNVLSTALMEVCDAVKHDQHMWGFALKYEIGPDVVGIQKVIFASQAIRVINNEPLDLATAPVYATVETKPVGKHTAEIHDITPPIDVAVAYMFIFETQDDLTKVMPLLSWIKHLSDDGFRIASYDMDRENTKILTMKICKEGSWEIDIVFDLNVLIKDNEHIKAIYDKPKAESSGEISPE